MNKNKDLRDFLNVIKKAGPKYYVEVKKTLSPHLEVGVIQHKLYKIDRNPVIYCPKIAGSKLPLITNVFGSFELLGVALGMDPARIDQATILHEYRKREAKLRPTRTVSRSKAPVKDVILRGKDVDLGLLPITHHAPLDSAKFITMGNMVCRDPDTGICNVGVYRHEVKGKRELGAMLLPYHHASFIAQRYAELGKEMEVALFIGHHPAVVLASMHRGSQDVDEFEVMGGLLGESLRVTPCETVHLPVPADAEIVIEGVIDPRAMIMDGPFGEFADHYGGQRNAYLIKVKAITMRKDAIYHDLDSAHPEHNIAHVLGLESAIYDSVKRVVPTVRSVNCPASGKAIFHLYVSIKKTLGGQGKLAGLAALSVPSYPVKTCIVVDEDVDVFDEKNVLWALATRMVPSRDITIIENCAGNALDPAAYDETRLKVGSMQDYMIIDATKPLTLPSPTPIVPPEDLWKKIRLEDYIKGFSPQLQE
jgi:2,5-furandicarboxylate decarboxylase 1